MNITMLIISIIGLAFVQIQMFKACPRGIRLFLAKFPFIGIIVNFAFSQLLLHFIGIAYGIGLANMISSVLFGFYIAWYKKHHQIKLTTTKWGMPKFVTKDDITWTE